MVVLPAKIRTRMKTNYKLRLELKSGMIGLQDSTKQISRQEKQYSSNHTKRYLDP